MLSLSGNEHGGNIHQLAQKLQVDPRTILDFSSNINPLGIPEPLKDRFIHHLDQLSYYPDPAYQTLCQNISQYLDLPASQIIPGNGASEIIYLLMATLKPKHLLLWAPTFGEYEKAARAAGVDVHYLELSAADGFQPDFARLAKDLEEVDCICLCNPNNPTSTLIPPAELRSLADWTKEKKIHWILDESFIELTTAGNRNSMVPWLKYYPNLFIIRSFTKILALPGLRLGYGLGSPEWIRTMAQNRIPWSVNALACMIGDYLGEIPEFLARTALWLTEEKKWLFQELQKIPALKPFPPQSNFILVQIVSARLQASEIQNKMASQGILIRNAANFHSLNEQYFRIAVKTHQQNQRLVDGLQKVVGV